MATLTTAAPPRAGGRMLMFLGVVVAVGGLVAYGLQLMKLHNTMVPWYAPVAAGVGALLVLLSLMRRVTILRILALLFCLALVGLEGWFLFALSGQPAYAGPIAKGKSFPAFRAARADGSAFTEAELAGDKDTVLLFFRGHW